MTVNPTYFRPYSLRLSSHKPLLIAVLLPVSLLITSSCVRSAGDVATVQTAGGYVGVVLGQAGAQKVITDFDAPFLFTYLAWEKRVTVENGHALIRGEGVSPKGGGGSNVELDLSASANLCPVIRVRVGAKNTLKTLKLMLSDDTFSKPDAEKHLVTFEFPLPDKPTSDFVTIYARGGATLTKPTTIGEAGNINPEKIRQWQLIGDWGGDGAVDIELDSVTLAEPDTTAKAAQAESIQADEQKRQQVERDRAALREKYGKRNPNSPNVVEVYRVAPDILAIGIQAGQVSPGRYEAYTKQAGDETRTNGDGVTSLIRAGKEVGYLIGKNKDGLVYYETFTGDPLLDEPAESLDSYSIVAEGAKTVKPIALWRKSKPTDQVQPGSTLAMRHVIYLKLPNALESGKKYMVRFADVLNVRQSETAFTISDKTMRSEAVHVPQIGFRTDDPVKVGFLSIWLGTGGSYQYAAPPKFDVINTQTGKSVLSGTATLAKGKDDKDRMWQGKAENYAKTAVYHLDFSALTAPGTYRVAVDGVGCSYPFTVGENVWKKAFVTQMRGLFHQRSGVELGAPYTTYRRPRSLYPGTDTTAFETRYNVVDGDGKSEAGEALVKNSTKIPIPEAWGGYHDAGDFNPRRVTHMRVTMAHLELLDIFPVYFAAVKLNIPVKPNVPDVLTEALFELDLFRRLQKPDGGIPYQIETNGDPSAFEVSWKQTKDQYVTAPDPWASWYYAGVAAKAAKLLAKYDPKLSATYRASAIKAMDWAEQDYIKRKANGTADKIKWEMKDARNYAALLCYDLTGDERWNAVFREDTVLKSETANLFQWGTAVQKDAAFAYANLPATRKPDPQMKARAMAGLKAQAESALNYASGNAFRVTTPDPGKPMFIGFWSTPDAIELCRAHFLTKDKRYLAGAVQACAFASGGNPSNITYTTGVGANPVKHPLQIDHRSTGQPAPEGITVYGNFDWPNWPDQQWALWPMKYSLGPNCKPSAYEWPVPEAYFDIYLYPATNEYTVDAWTPNVYVWGYLAARK